MPKLKNIDKRVKVPLSLPMDVYKWVKKFCNRTMVNGRKMTMSCFGREAFYEFLKYPPKFLKESKNGKKKNGNKGKKVRQKS